MRVLATILFLTICRSACCEEQQNTVAETGDPFEVESRKAAEELRWNAQAAVRIEWIAVEHESLTQLLESPGSMADGEALHAKVLALIEGKKARQGASVFQVIRKGQRGRLEATLEWAAARCLEPPMIVFAKDGSHTKTKASPRDFVRSKMGLEVEIEPEIPEDLSRLQICFTPKLTRVLGKETWGQAESSVETTLTGSMRISAAPTCEIGRWRFVGLHTPPVAGRGAAMFEQIERLMVFVKADLLMSDKALPPTQPPKSKIPSEQLHFLGEYVLLPQKEADLLLENYGRTGDGDAQRKLAGTWIKEGKGRVWETTALISHSGERSRVESFREVPHPVQWANNTVPQNTLLPRSDSKLTQIPPMPGNLEIRNCGIQLEIDPVIREDGRTIDLNLSPTITLDWGRQEFGEGTCKVEQMLAHEIGIATAIRVTEGRYAIVSSLPHLVEPGNDPNNAPMRLILFVRCDLDTPK